MTPLKDAPVDLAAEFGFHPLIARWFAGKFGEPTEPQRLGWPCIAAGDDTLIAAPTGSGKTLTAFLAVLDRLMKDAEADRLAQEIRVVYVSPLRALSNDMHRNLSGPLRELAQLAEEEGRSLPPLKVGLRTGDSTAAQRAALLKRPPHLLVTTPESLYLLLTSDKGRERLRSVEVVIVDEIHALMRDKRGAHLALSLERLEHLCGRRLQRIGLSATQKPLELVAEFLAGHPEAGTADEDARPIRVIDVGHARWLDLDVEVPVGELSAVCTHEQWDQIHARLVELIQAHRSTVIFVNTRRLAERLTHSLSERLGPDRITSHHGSLSAAMRHKTEQRLKSGQLQAVVATASLELGIDVGYIDLVVQIGSPRSIATLLQRIGRSGHCLHAIPKGRIVPLTRDELLECLALLRAVKQHRLDTIRPPEKPLDVLVQQIVAEVSCQEWDVDALWALCRRAYPYRNLARDEFDEALRFLSEGFVSHSGWGKVYLHYDRVGRRVRARPMARPAAIANGGAIPEIASYRVVAEPGHTVVGSVDEDFAIESLRGDVFLLGNTSWRIEHVRGTDVTVSDAHGAPPTIPFWFGEAPGRTLELSEEVSRLRADLEARVDDIPGAVRWLMEETVGWASPTQNTVDPELAGAPHPTVLTGAARPVVATASNRRKEASTPIPSDDVWNPSLRDVDVPEYLRALVEYVAAEKAALGVVPRQEKIVFERFFDETGGMQLVVHAPFGSAITRAWGYALRKRFCRSFDFELQATADDDGFILSIGPQHSFPIESLFGMLTSTNARGLLEQAVLVQPIFQVRWRWNVTRALLVLKQKFGKKVPPALQRFRADDLLTSVFPNLTGCQENHTGDLEIPDHPLVRQTMHDCLHEALDIDGLLDVLRRIEQGEIELVARDTREPSPFCYELLNSNPYTFLDGGEIQERRARALATPSTISIDGMRDLGWLDPAAIAQVVQEAAPLVRSADELHDLLLSVIVLPDSAARPLSHGGGRWLDALSDQWFAELEQQRRAASWIMPDGRRAWSAVERWPAVAEIYPERQLPPGFAVPEGVRTDWESASARVAVLRGWMEICGPVRAEDLAKFLGFTEGPTSAGLEALEGEGTVLRGRFTPAGDGGEKVEWCHRRLLARIHRLTLAGLRKQIEPVDVSVFVQFLFEHHGMTGDSPRSGINGLFEVVSLLQGVDLPAVTWERDVLPPRLSDYDPSWLDELCLSGEVGWGRLSPPRIDADKSRPMGNLTKVVPVSIFLRADLPWLTALLPPPSLDGLGSLANELRELLAQQGALFAGDLLQLTRMLPDHFQEALGELIWRGLVTADGFGGLRALMADKAESSGRRGDGPPRAFVRKRSTTSGAGRWSLWRRPLQSAESNEQIEAWAWQLLRRWGVVFRDLLERESGAPRWWELLQVYRRLEARGELRGGRFITGVAGEQFALESTVRKLRAVREASQKRSAADVSFVCLAACDPLNLTGILDSGPRVPGVATNRVVYRDGVASAALIGDEMAWLTTVPVSQRERIAEILAAASSVDAAGRNRRQSRRPPRRSNASRPIPRPLIR